MRDSLGDVTCRVALMYGVMIKIPSEKGIQSLPTRLSDRWYGPVALRFVTYSKTSGDCVRVLQAKESYGVGYIFTLMYGTLLPAKLSS
jgi:hypothetical protein